MANRARALAICAQMTGCALLLALAGCNDDSSSGSSIAPPAPAATASAPTLAPAPAVTPPASTPAPVANGQPATLVTNFNSSDGCLPAELPSADEMFASTKKVFAHYFHPFPLSLDNATSSGDYYNTQYLTKNGESGKWSAQGGYLRQRPLGSAKQPAADWQLLNMKAEVRLAIARGISGFTFDVMSVDAATRADGPLQLMLQAAQAVDSRFKIIVMPDISALKSNSSAVVSIIAAAAGHSAAYHLSDGRVVASAFNAGINSPVWWAAVLKQLSAQGVKVAMVPTFLTWSDYAGTFSSLSYGFGDWGTATTGVASAMQADPDVAHSIYGKLFMMPVDPQQYRPKDFTYWEAGNSGAFRTAWNSSIKGDADWVQVVTWNDFSEGSQISPYTDVTLKRDIGTGYYNLNGFYATWFLTGQQPQITHDVLYYFYRREPSQGGAPAQSQRVELAAGTRQDNIELLAFLTAPGVLKITIGGTTYTENAPAGITSFKVPTHPGTPLFALARNGSEVFSFQGGVQIYGGFGLPSGVQDLTYWSGSAATTGKCSL